MKSSDISPGMRVHVRAGFGTMIVIGVGWELDPTWGGQGGQGPARYVFTGNKRHVGLAFRDGREWRPTSATTQTVQPERGF